MHAGLRPVTLPKIQRTNQSGQPLQLQQQSSSYQQDQQMYQQEYRREGSAGHEDQYQRVNPHQAHTHHPQSQHQQFIQTQQQQSYQLQEQQYFKWMEMMQQQQQQSSQQQQQQFRSSNEVQQRAHSTSNLYRHPQHHHLPEDQHHQNPVAQYHHNYQQQQHHQVNNGESQMSPLPQSIWEQRFKGGGAPLRPAKSQQPQIHQSQSQNPQMRGDWTNQHQNQHQQQDWSHQQQEWGESPLLLNRSYNQVNAGGNQGQYLEVENSQLSINVANMNTPHKQQSRLLMTPAQTECNVLTARTCNEPVSRLFQNGQPVQQQNNGSSNFQEQAYWHGGHDQEVNRVRSAAHHQSRNPSYGPIVPSLDQNYFQPEQQPADQAQLQQFQDRRGRGGGGGQHHDQQQEQYQYQLMMANQHSTSADGLYAPRLDNNNNNYYQRYPQQQPSSSASVQGNYHQAGYSQFQSQQPVKNNRPQTTMAVDLSPMTHSSKIFVPNYNQKQVGSSLDPKSVYKLNSHWHFNAGGEDDGSHYQQQQQHQHPHHLLQIPPWQQKFQGGASPNNRGEPQQNFMFYDANQNNPVSQKTPLQHHHQYEMLNNSAMPSLPSQQQQYNDMHQGVQHSQYIYTPNNQNQHHQLVQASMEMGATAVSMSNMRGEEQASVDYNHSQNYGHYHSHNNAQHMPQSAPQYDRRSSNKGSEMKVKRSPSNQTSDSQSLLVKPSDQGQVLALRQNFLQIARREREDSKDRDKNFMPEVRRDDNVAVQTGISQDATTPPGIYSGVEKPRLVQRPPKGNYSSHSMPPQQTSISNHSFHQNLSGPVNLQNQNNFLNQNTNMHHNYHQVQQQPTSQQQHKIAVGENLPQSQVSRRMSHENYQSSHFVNSSQANNNNNNLQNCQSYPLRRVQSGQGNNPQSQVDAETNQEEKNIFHSPNASLSNHSMSQKSMSGVSIGGRSLLAQQMGKNGLNFENSSSRLAQRVNDKTDLDKSIQKKVIKQPSPSQTIYNMGQFTSLIDGDGGTPLRQNSKNNILNNNSHQILKQAEKPRQPRAKPIGRPVGCKTMNDREFQKYQRSLFMQSSPFSPNNNLNKNQNQRSRRFNADGAGSNKRDDDITNDTGPAMQQPFLFQEDNNQSEFGISNISQIKGDNQSQFMESGDADNLLCGDSSNKNNQKEQISFGTSKGPNKH